MMSIGSLFSGIGGLELGLERSGLGDVVWQVEQDEFCRRVLTKHWPNANRIVTDVREAGRNSLSLVDVICGGFPCQDVSSAGAGAGLAGARSGLWYEYLRIVDELRPSIVVVENVASGAKRWLCEVRGNLHALGYRTRAFAISAADVGAPHLRKRVFVVASDAFGFSVRLESGRRSGPNRQGQAFVGDDGQARTTPHANGDRESIVSINAEMGGPSSSFADALTSRRERASAAEHEGWKRTTDGAWGTSFGGVVPVVHGLSGGVAGRNRRARIRALGNAVVPQCAEAIGRLIKAEIVPALVGI